MKELPILFSSTMVRAILDGSKTQTRRVIKPQPTFVSGGWHWAHKSYDNGDGAHYSHTDEECAKRLLLKAGIAPKVGEMRWVREAFWAYGQWSKNGKTKTGRQKWRFVTFNKQARFESQPKTSDREVCGWYKRNARFMPRWASRITLEIANVRVERLQDISESDAKSEGTTCRSDLAWGHVGVGYQMAKQAVEHGHRFAFKELWDSIQLQRAVPKRAFAWSSNPWVWVISFKRIQP